MILPLFMILTILAIVYAKKKALIRRCGAIIDHKKA